jgi:hypothetical protein
MSNAGAPSIYPPLNSLKPVAQDMWIVDGPIIHYGPSWLKMPFPTRMTLARLGDGGLFVHSPTPLTAELREQVEATGPVRWLVAPNRLHYWWIPQWHAAFPAAEVWLAPRVREQAAGRIPFYTRVLDATDTYPWDDGLRTIPVTGSFLTEFVFFHGASRTLVLTDLVENFERERLHSAWMRWLTRLGGVQDPDGQTPRDMRLTFRRQMPGVRAAIAAIVELDPDRVILAHGRWYDENGTQELRRAFRWVLGR